MNDISVNIIVAIIVGSSTLIIREWFARRREERERNNWQVGNLKIYYFEEYLSQGIKDKRRKLQEHLNNPPKVIKDLNPERDTISKALQRVGIMTYLGAIPLSYALIMNGYQIVTDWILISPFVEKIRDITNARKNRLCLEQIPYHRRHAEWLCIICFMWIKSQPFVVNDEIENKISKFVNYYNGTSNLLRRERLLFSHEKMLASKGTATLRKSIRQRFILRKFILFLHNFFRVKFLKK